MANPAGESNDEVLKLDFDRRLMLQFRGSVVTSDAGLLAYRELDDALGLSTMSGETLADARTGKNERHALVGLLRQSVFGRLAGYEDVNDAEGLRHDPAYQHEAFDRYPFHSNRREEYVQMPGKLTNSILRPPFRPPQVPAAVRSSRLSCGKVGKAQIFTSARESSGESRLKRPTASKTIATHFSASKEAEIA